eukprot:gnl/TRDRNA2_/TRDRNA2_27596_c0_seq1.p1 gnl/TRDRNA2_/TRDRNA2_27596_c0~~gnl/TRDRNA2_/TRDRNA2_27596_c0_seq1.p1  ORF type:complete len:234 (-),score=37.67 gnl/TRDRNA2_/TRDRNA2_27596_c0_seq1:205-906(-)
MMTATVCAIASCAENCNGPECTMDESVLLQMSLRHMPNARADSIRMASGSAAAEEEVEMSEADATSRAHAKAIASYNDVQDDGSQKHQQGYHGQKHRKKLMQHAMQHISESGGSVHSALRKNAPPAETKPAEQVDENEKGGGGGGSYPGALHSPDYNPEIYPGDAYAATPGGAYAAMTQLCLSIAPRLGFEPDENGVLSVIQVAAMTLKKLDLDPTPQGILAVLNEMARQGAL